MSAYPSGAHVQLCPFALSHAGSLVHIDPTKSSIVKVLGIGMETTDVFIVGAGPTGLLMAYQLARMGVGTCIIGRHLTTLSHSLNLGFSSVYS